METLIPINVVVGDRSYRVKIEQANEEIVRKTVKTVNDKIIEFKALFAGKDMQDYIAMAILWYATTASEEGGISADMGTKMNELETLLDKVLLK